MLPAPGGDHAKAGQSRHVSMTLAPTTSENFPATHATQVSTALAPEENECVPAGQSRHVEAPNTLEYLPRSHSRHTLWLCAPSQREYVPSWQARHLLESEFPEVSAYLPAPHLSQDLSEVAPVLNENLPGPQSEHPALPELGLNLPGRHSVQAPPWGPDDPALQIQAVLAELPAGDKDLDGHAVHVSLDLPPGAVEYLPA